MTDLKIIEKTTANDPFFFDQDRDILWGQVEGDEPDIPENVTLRLTEEGLSFSCDCGETNETEVCRHVVAVLCNYADQCGKTDKLLTATDSAIKNRIKRGRSEVEVTCLSGEQWFCTD